MPRKKHQNAPAATGKTRRDVLSLAALYGTGAVVLGGGGTAFALDFRAKLAEGDLSKIGNGTPSVVQIHDPQCGLCTNLQTATRRAFRLCDQETSQFLVANVRNAAGAAFQARMRLPHVTLAFFDGAGRHVHTIEGVTAARDIKAAMTQHFT